MKITLDVQPKFVQEVLGKNHELGALVFDPALDEHYFVDQFGQRQELVVKKTAKYFVQTTA